MNPDKFYQRTKLFSDILYEIFNVESNYRTELSVLNLKLLKKLEEHNNKINKRRRDKLMKSLPSSKAFKSSTYKNLDQNLTFTNSKLNDNFSLFKKEDNPMIDKLMSEGLQNLLTFYKTKHKIISKEVSNLGIIIYNFSSSQKKYENLEDMDNLEKLQNIFDLNFAKFMKIKKIYFEKMNDLELFFHEEENNKKIKDPNSKKKENNTNDENRIERKL